MADLNDYRQMIDEIDAQMIPLLEQRMNLARNVAEYKRIHDLPVLQSAREEQVLQKAVDCLQDQEYAEQARHLMCTLMELSRAAQHRDLVPESSVPLDPKRHDYTGKLGYPGVEGSFSEQALAEFFGRSGKPYPEFADVFDALEAGEIDFAMLPLENSSTGSIAQNYDLLDRYGFVIVGEHTIQISQNLIALEGASLNTIETVYSHAQGLEQSKGYLALHREWETIHFLNTSISAKMVAQSGDFTKAAIASRRAAELYGLTILASDIQDNQNNTTRFIVVARQLLDMQGDKISISFTLDNESGSLHNVLRHFSQGQINMVKIESRPIAGELWNYRFYLDFEGTMQKPLVAALLESLARETKAFRILGAYPKAKQ